MPPEAKEAQLTRMSVSLKREEQTERGGGREGETDRHTERGRVGGIKRERERETKTETETDTERQRQRDRDSETQRARKRERERQRERGRERQGERARERERTTDNNAINIQNF